jgi:hypothetical protein
MTTAEANGIKKYLAIYVITDRELQRCNDQQADNIAGSQLVVRFLTHPRGVILDEPGLGKEGVREVHRILHALRAGNHELYLDGQLPVVSVPAYRIGAELILGELIS